MLPKFPEFKKLELSDRKYIEEITSKYPPYSDYNFTSMWSWNIDGEMMISELNSNLVVRFSDYVTAAPVFSFIGNNDVKGTTDTLLKYLKHVGLKAKLELIPEETVDQLDKDEYIIQEQPEHYDYIVSVDRLMPHDGVERKLSSRRRLIKKFKEHNTCQIQEIDINDSKVKDSIKNVYIKWELQLERGENNIEHLRKALDRLLELQETEHNLMAFGIYMNDELIGYSINEIREDGYAIGHFQQGNIQVFSGIYALLMHEIAPFMKNYKCDFINVEQDLGISGLRSWKSSLMPAAMLKKYSISNVDNRFVRRLFKSIIKA